METKVAGIYVPDEKNLPLAEQFLICIGVDTSEYWLDDFVKLNFFGIMGNFDRLELTYDPYYEMFDIAVKLFDRVETYYYNCEFYKGNCYSRSEYHLNSVTGTVIESWYGEGDEEGYDKSRYLTDNDLSQAWNDIENIYRTAGRKGYCELAALIEEKIINNKEIKKE